MYYLNRFVQIPSRVKEVYICTFFLKNVQVGLKIRCCRREPNILSEIPRTSDPDSIQINKKRGLDPPWGSVPTPGFIANPTLHRPQDSRPNSFKLDRLLRTNQRHQKRSSSYRSSPTDPFSSFSNPNFEFFSTWNVTELEEVSTATEMSDDMLRSLGFPVPSTLAPTLERGTPRLPIVDNHFIHFVSSK